MPSRKRMPRKSMPQVQRATSAGVTSTATAGDRARPRRPVGRFAAPIGALVVIIALATYLGTAARDLVFGDSPELIAVAATLGVAHAPGYPVWTLLAHVFSWLPIGSLPFRVGLLSVVCGAACVGVVYLISLRVARSVPAAAVAALGLALHPLFWQWSIVAEVFTLHALLAAIVVYCALRWAEHPATVRWLYGAALAGGLGLANQQTIALLLPAIAYLIWTRRQALRAKPLAIVKAAAAAAVGLVPYAYLPIAASRDPVWSFGDLSSLGDVIGHVLRAEYGSGQLITGTEFQGGPTLDRLMALGSAVGPIELGLGLVGLIELARRRPQLFWFFAIALAICGPAFALYANADVRIELIRAVLDRFFVLPVTIAAPLVALGLRLVASWLPARSLSRRTVEIGVAAVLATAIVVGARGTWVAVDRHADHVARHFAEDILASVPPNGILIVAGDAAAFPTEYLATIEGARPDVSIVHQTYLPAGWYVRSLRRHDTRVALPYPAFTGPPATFGAFLTANGSRQVFTAGDLLDPDASRAFVAQPRGLVQLVVPAGGPLDPDTDARETDRLFAGYRPPDPASLRGRAFDEIVLNDYGFALMRVGRAYEAAKRPADAKPWYERALQVVPDLVDAKNALARLR